LFAGGVIGFVALVVVAFTGGDTGPAGVIVLNIAVWGAMLAYILQLISFIILRRKYPNLNRPYKSPWGMPGAVIALVIAVIAFLGFLVNPAFLPAIVAIIVVYAIVMLVFAVWGRHRLVLSPEERYSVENK
jgi:ethanolamine permease